MIVGAFPLSEHLRRVYLAGGRIAETTKICLAKFRRRVQPITRRGNGSNTIVGLLSWLTCPVPRARKGPGNQT